MAQYRTGIIFLLNIINQKFLLMAKPPNGWRYAPHAFCGVLVSGTRERRFDGTHSKPRKVPENAHAVPKDGSSTTTPALHQTQCGASVARRTLSGFGCTLCY